MLGARHGTKFTKSAWISKQNWIDIVAHNEQQDYWLVTHLSVPCARSSPPWEKPTMPFQLAEQWPLCIFQSFCSCFINKQKRHISTQFNHIQNTWLTPPPSLSPHWIIIIFNGWNDDNVSDNNLTIHKYTASVRNLCYANHVKWLH